MSSFTNVKTFASLPKTTRGQHITIGGDPRGKNFLYCNNNSVIIRDLGDPTLVDIYTEHAVATTVAKYSPSGFYIASGGEYGLIFVSPNFYLHEPIAWQGLGVVVYPLLPNKARVVQHLRL